MQLNIKKAKKILGYGIGGNMDNIGLVLLGLAGVTVFTDVILILFAAQTWIEDHLL
jgi:hypothetical protein